jgi:hypothetical protein
VDVVAHDLPIPAARTWLIEAKDYRVITNPPKPTNLSGLAATVEAKVRVQPHPSSGQHAALFPASWIANVLLQLRINLADIDNNPLVLDLARTATANVPWSVS